MNLDELKDEVGRGAIDTVLLGFTDMQGRLQGKRLTAEFFLDSVVHHGAEGCNYLLAVDVDMNTVSGYAMSSWDLGYGDFEMKPDMDTLMPVPWHEGTALVLADLAWPDHSPVVASPRQILRRQIERLAERGLQAYAGTELEFMVFRNTYEEAWNKAYRDLEPANYYNVDYSMIGTARVEPLVRRIRNAMAAAGMKVENAKGECNFGQHEINFLYGPVLQTADHHSIYKTGAKEIAAPGGRGDHLHGEVRRARGQLVPHPPLAPRDDGDVATPRRSTTPSSPASSPACGPDAVLRRRTSTRTSASSRARSRRRRSPGATTTAPARCAWSATGRRSGSSCGSPGADVNPYLALSAMIAAGLHGMEQGLELEPPYEGNAYESDKPRVPATLRDARDAVRRQRGRPRGVRRRGRRPLPQLRADRARRLRQRGDRLGALPGLRAALRSSDFRPQRGRTVAIGRTSRPFR